MTYRVQVTETLQRTVDVEADSAIDAERLVRQMYRDERIVLGAEDHVATEITRL